MKDRSAVDVVLTLVDAYFHLRDVNAVMECLTEDVIWIGMEEGEIYCGSSAVHQMLLKDIAAHPEPYETEMKELPKSVQRSDAWVTVIADGERKLDAKHCFTIRSTVECVRTAEGWRVNSIHTSVPNMAVEKIRLKTELTEEQRKQEMLMRGIPGGVAIYRLKTDGTVPTDYVSEGLAQSLGYTAEEFLSLLRIDSRCNLVPEDIPKVMERVTEGLERNDPISAVYRVYNKKHQPVCIRLDANIIERETNPDEIAVLYAVHAIVSETAEAALREQALYRNLLDNLDIAYFEHHADGSFYTSERYAQYQVGKMDPPAMTTDFGCKDCIHPDDLPILLQFLDKKQARAPKVSATLRCKMADGTYRWTEIIGIFDYAPNGKLMRQIGVFRDAENEWAEQNKRLTEALEAARQASRSKTEFFSRVSHDIRTPLNAILGFSHIAQNSPEQADTYMVKIQTSGEYLLGLINDVLDMSKIESESFELHEKPTDIRGFLSEIADMFTQVAEQSGVTLAVDFSRTYDQWLVLDRLRLKQVYSNLLSNAIKFSTSGTTILWTVVHHLNGNEVQVTSTIQDSGCGMSDDFLQRVFQPFAQEANRYSEKVTGTGLGLAIVKNLVDRMNGTIKIESRLNVGTTVTLNFRWQVAPAPDILSSEERPQLKAASLSGKRILLCEDNALNREIAVYLLKGKGILVDEAADGRQGLEIFRTSSIGWFDGILMDIRMPEMDGLECTKQVRSLSRPDAGTVPIIALTANAYAEDVQAALDAGMNDHLPKPVKPEDLYQMLQNYLSED